MQTTTGAMSEAGVRRIVTLTGAAALVAGGGLQLQSRLNRLVLSAMDRTAVVDSEGHLDVLRASGVDWTTVCSPTITPEGPPGYVLRSTMPSLTAKVSGPAVAVSRVDLVQDADHLGEAVGIVQQ